MRLAKNGGQRSRAAAIVQRLRSEHGIAGAMPSKICTLVRRQFGVLEPAIFQLSQTRKPAKVRPTGNMADTLNLLKGNEALHRHPDREHPDRTQPQVERLEENKIRKRQTRLREA